MMGQALEPPELYDPNAPQERPRYIEEWQDGTFRLTGNVYGGGTRAMNWFFASVMACVTCAGVYCAASSSSLHEEVIYSLVAIFGIGCIILLLWRSPAQTVRIVMGPLRATVSYEPARGAPAAIDVPTEEITGFITNARLGGNVPGSMELFMGTREGKRKIWLYHPSLEATLSRPAAARLNWALARVRHEAEARERGQA